MPPPSVPAPFTDAAPTASSRGLGVRYGLVIIGILLLVWCGDFSKRQKNFIHYGAIVAAIGVAFIPAVNRAIGRFCEWIRQPSRRTVRVATLVISLFASWYFIQTAERQDRVLIPKYQDEQMYAIQTQMVARGRLWLPQHPLADFFETFHVMVRPVYAPIYFPGTAMLFAPTVWFGLAPWSMGVLLAGGIVGLCYRVFTELFDGVAGALAALMMISLPMLHFVSVMIMSHAAVLFLGMMLLWSWLRWRSHHSWGWAIAMGALAGWAAITRPFDAVCFAAPVGLAVLWELRSQPARSWLRTGLMAAVGGLPFLAVQGVLDYGTTGNVLKTPASAYAAKYWPTAGMGFQTADRAQRPPTRLVQFQEYYDHLLVPGINAHHDAGFFRWMGTRVLPAMLKFGVTAPFLLLFVPLGILAIRRFRWVVAAALPLFAVFYAFYPFVLDHYSLAVAPALIALVLGGIAVLRKVHSAATAQMLATAASFSVAVACLTSVNEVNPGVRDPSFHAPFLVDIYTKLADIPERAVVLFQYKGGGDCHEEPVYNTDVAWPDDAKLIRAHDLGPENARLYEYYAKRDPERAIFRFDRRNGELTRLGTARDMAAAYPIEPRAKRPK